MKPNADMITKVLHNFRVNGKFDQDQLIIGRGVDEQLQLMISDTVGIRYTPEVAGERTFTILGTTDHPVFDETVTLYPYSKPVNDFTNSWVLADEDVIWISDKFTDPDFPNTRYIMYIGGAGGPMPNQWRVHTIGSSDTGIYGVDWNNASNTPDFLGAQENVTWSNGEASTYPSSPSDWSTSGYQGVQPTSFSMTNTEGSNAKLEYTNDGITWYPFGGTGSAGITYEPIEFTGSDLKNDGTLHIQHNFNDKNVLCLGYTPQPKEITYLDNEIVLDYSDQNSANLSGAVWFVNSKQEMLSGGTSDDPLTGDPVYVVSNAGTTSVNGEYRLIKPEYYNQYVDQAYIDAHTIVALYTNGTAVLETNGAEPYFYKIGFTSSDTPFYAGVNSTAPNDPLTVTTWVVLVGTAPAPTIAAWSGGVIDPITKPTYTLTGAGNSDVNGDYTIVTPDAYTEYLGENMVVDNVKCMYTNGSCVIYGYSIRDKNTDYLAIATKGWNLMTRPIYICSQPYGSVDYADLTSTSVVLVTSLGAQGPPPIPTITKYKK